MKGKNCIFSPRNSNFVISAIRVFNLNSSVNKMLQNETIPPCEKVVAEGINPILDFLLGAPVYPLLPCLMKEFSNGGKNSRQKL